MKPVETLEEQQAKDARAALEALEQAYAYYIPEPPVAAVQEWRQDQLFEYYQAA
ncbi:hypothetical protein [Leisingera sp. ANG-DT]|uniref:hypothetical protein n=1 Tax=Leisingera sp. ANG-DT TaxID=1577897 RepID=UPI000B10146F|nr:hypothetical protein [Leisingera sp. ANG-DT]